jgi:hypothetical protein
VGSAHRKAHRATQTQNKRTQTSIPQARFEPMSPVYERVKTVHALYRATTDRHMYETTQSKSLRLLITRVSCQIIVICIFHSRACHSFYFGQCFHVPFLRLKNSKQKV